MITPRGFANTTLLVGTIAVLVVLVGVVYGFNQQDSQYVYENESTDVSGEETCSPPSIIVSSRPSFGLTTTVDHSIELQITSDQSGVMYKASPSQINVFGIKNGVLTGSAPKDSGAYPLTLTATNTCGAKGTKELTFHVLPFVNIQADLSDDITDIATLNNPGPTILYNSSVRLSWRFQGSDNCEVLADTPVPWTGSVPKNSAYGNTGEKDSGPLTQTTTYTLRCVAGSNIENSDSVKVTVHPKDTPAVDLDVRSAGENAFGFTQKSDGPITLVRGGSAVLSWNSQNVNSCTVSATGATPMNQAFGISNSGLQTGVIRGKTTYKIDCQSSAGLVSDTVTIDVGDVGD